MRDDIDPRDTPLHPRRRAMLLGHEQAERKLLQAFHAGRLHHAWLITGPRGVGKATLAYRFARFLLKHPSSSGTPTSLDVDPSDPVFHRVAAGSHPDLFVIERAYDLKSGKVKSETGVDVARGATGFFARTAGEGGWRVAIVDPADDLNEEAANALLKIIEEPPERSIFLILANSPGQVLSTIRSRSIRLTLAPLTEHLVVEVLRSVLAPEAPPAGDLALAASLSRGSPGRAMGLLQSNGAKVFATFRSLVSSLPNLDRRQVSNFADQLQSRTAAEEFTVFCELLEDWIAEEARKLGSAGRHAANRWATAHSELRHSIRVANALNLDRRQLVMHAFDAIQDAARNSRG